MPPSDSNKGSVSHTPEPAVDYSRLRLGENKSFVEAWEEAFKWNEEAARVKGEELASLMALKQIHTVSPLLYKLLSLIIPVAPKHLTVVTWDLR